MVLRHLLKNDLRNFNFDSDLTSNPVWAAVPERNHIDLPRMREGRLGGQVFSCHTIIYLMINYVFHISFGLLTSAAELNLKMQCSFLWNRLMSSKD